jgi:hypothetical protein
MPESPDLFGEIVVTWPDVFAWIEAVAGIPRDSPRAEHYIRGWNVPAKVARAKRDGTFHDVIDRPSTPSACTWWHRFCWR